MNKNIFSFKKLRVEYFSKYFSYDNELAKIIDKEKSHDFLKNQVVQNMHIYLVEYLLAFSRRWFNKNDFTVLDWGCGKCQVSYLLKKRNINVLSCDVDIPGHGDSKFEQYTPIAEYANINVIPLKHQYILPFADESFDVVLSFGVLEHVDDDKKSLDEINRILKPNGLFFCFWLPYKYSPRQNWIKLKGDNYHDRLYVMDKMKHLLDETRFNLTDYWYRDLLPFRRLPFGKKNFRIMENFDNWLCRNTVLKYLATNIEFVGNKK
jgi:SAM-dependent methyltransferase